MAVVERDVVLQGKTSAGDTTIDMPITALKNIEDTAEVKAAPEEGDYIPLIDSKSDWQMKKAPASAFRVTVFRQTATVPNTGWQSYDGGRLVCINVSVPGIREADVDGDFSVVQTGSEATDKPIRDALSLITRVKTMDDYIVVYATRIPSVAIPVKIEVIR